LKTQWFLKIQNIFLLVSELVVLNWLSTEYMSSWLLFFVWMINWYQLIS
jgi:hypothetical protein